ncbi:hypothetical protein HC928_22025 [bacterium]|nr:hypothetical protein [bacterium]
MRRFIALVCLLVLVVAPGGLLTLNAQDDESTPALPLITPPRRVGLLRRLNLPPR